MTAFFSQKRLWILSAGLSGSGECVSKNQKDSHRHRQMRPKNHFAGNFLQFARDSPNLLTVTSPLAIVFYEKLLPGQQLVNRLQDLGYRVQVVSDASALQEQTETQKPMLIVAEFPMDTHVIGHAIAALKKNLLTLHVPVLAYVPETNDTLQEILQATGADLVANENGVLDQLPQLLDQVLRLD